MKPLLTIILLLSIFTAADATDTLSVRVDRLEKSVDTVKESIGQINKGSSKTIQQNQPAALKIPRKLSGSQKAFVIMPVILFLILFFVLLIWLNRGGFSLADALKGDVPIKVEQQNTAFTDAAKAATTAAAPVAIAAAAAGVNNMPVQIVMPSNMPSTVSVSQTDQDNNPVLPQSSSRFIALFTGFAAIIIAICLISYYVYFAISGLQAPNFNEMFEAICGLGIGVVPYAVTKFTQK